MKLWFVQKATQSPKILSNRNKTQQAEHLCSGDPATPSLFIDIFTSNTCWSAKHFSVFMKTTFSWSVLTIYDDTATQFNNRGFILKSWELEMISWVSHIWQSLWLLNLNIKHVFPREDLSASWFCNVSYVQRYWVAFWWDKEYIYKNVLKPIESLNKQIRNNLKKQGFHFI